MDSYHSPCRILVVVLITPSLLSTRELGRLSGDLGACGLWRRQHSSFRRIVAMPRWNIWEVRSCLKYYTAFRRVNGPYSMLWLKQGVGRWPQFHGSFGPSPLV